MWLISITVSLFATGIFHLVVVQVIDHLKIKAEKKGLIFGEALLKAIRLPIGFLIWLMSLSFICSVFLMEKKHLFFISYLSQIKSIGIILILCWTFIRLIKNFEGLYLHHSTQKNKKIDKTLIHAGGQLSTMVVVIIGLLMIMQVMNIPIAGLLAFGGIGGAAVAFASKELITNFFGGMVIYMDRPFKVGDWIRSPDKNIEGTVEYIGWRMTRIINFDKRPLYVPNGVFLTISVENPSRMAHRRIKTIVGVRYEDASKINEITHKIRHMLEEHQEIDKTQSINVSLDEFGPSSLNLVVSAYTKRTKSDQFQAIKHEILMGILDIVAAQGAECAFPTQTLYVKQQEN